MRMSCNGCRVLRKGCSDDCSIRPCLEWIKSSDSQANATVFLAKFYGRAGLMNLINAGPAHLRPAIFKSLLYEACGRIVNPIYGSAGLLWSGSWQLCQTAAEAVLKGAPITQIATDAAETKNGPPLKAVDIRHVNKDNFSGSSGLNRVRTRCRFKRSGGKAKLNQLGRVGTDDLGHEVVNRSPSHESSLSHQSEAVVGRENRESESLASAETAEPELVVGSGPGLDSAGVGDQRADADDGEMKLKLSLGLGFEPKQSVTKELEVKGAVGSGQYDEAGLCKLVLGLDYSDH